MNVAPCPTCKKPVAYSPANKWRPFCSERCKLIDLGDWASEKNAIPAEEETQMSEELPTAIKPDA